MLMKIFQFDRKPLYTFRRFTLMKFVASLVRNNCRYWANILIGPLIYFSDDLVQMCVDYIRDYPLMCAVCVGVPLLLLLAFYFLMSGEDEYKKSKSKKKSKKKEAKKD